jgi:hypothetical protein
MCLLNDGLPLDEVLKKTDDMLAYAKTSKAIQCSKSDGKRKEEESEQETP